MLVVWSCNPLPITQRVGDNRSGIGALHCQPRTGAPNLGAEPNAGPAGCQRVEQVLATRGRAYKCRSGCAASRTVA
jgi:hypothetical protein